MTFARIGIIRERKNPPDARAPFTPRQCARITKEHGLDMVVEPSPVRCYTDAEYRNEGIRLNDELSDCDLLLGIKEVPPEQLLPNKTYLFFSHTIKKQAHNRKLLRAVLEKNIRLIDYETITDEKGGRLIAFGRFAGMVGAHNGVMLYGQRSGLFDLPRLKDLHDYSEAVAIYKTVYFQKMKIVLTGHGRVGQGAAQVLTDMGIHRLSPNDFLQYDGQEAVFTQLSSEEYVCRKSDGKFDKKEFYANPDRYESHFLAYARKADVMINGIYWDSRSPAFFTKEEMASEHFSIKTIADVTCDIAPVSSIPSTLFASTIAAPVFGYDPVTGEEVPPFTEGVIDMMTIDNLPSELPRDASESFGNQFIEHVLPDLLRPSEQGPIERATIAANGQLMPRFSYLSDYVAGRE
jgi:saccharopine dehydrogenase (NAD+, L-lysine-forming)